MTQTVYYCFSFCVWIPNTFLPPSTWAGPHPPHKRHYLGDVLHSRRAPHWAGAWDAPNQRTGVTGWKWSRRVAQVSSCLAKKYLIWVWYYIFELRLGTLETRFRDLLGWLLILLWRICEGEAKGLHLRICLPSRGRHLLWGELSVWCRFLFWIGW